MICEFYLISIFADDNVAVIKNDPEDGYIQRRD